MGKQIESVKKRKQRVKGPKDSGEVGGLACGDLLAFGELRLWEVLEVRAANFERFYVTLRPKMMDQCSANAQAI